MRTLKHTMDEAIRLSAMGRAYRRDGYVRIEVDEEGNATLHSTKSGYCTRLWASSYPDYVWGKKDWLPV